MNKKLRELIARFPHVNPIARRCTDAELEAYLSEGIAAQNAEVERLKARIVWLECEAKAHDVASVPDYRQLIKLLERVRLNDEESKKHGRGATYWNNAVFACQIAIRDELAAAPSAPAAPEVK